MRNRFAIGQPDANHHELARCYVDQGCSVVHSTGLGFGFPDLVVGVLGLVTELVEVKTEDGDFTPPQKTFVSIWRGSKVRVVRCREDVIAHVYSMRQKALKASKS